MQDDQEALSVRRISACISEAARELGYPAVKPEQLDVTVAFIGGRDVFAVLPTGFGKSLCYGCLRYAFDLLQKQCRGHSLIIVISPLIAIMKDQVS